MKTESVLMHIICPDKSLFLFCNSYPEFNFEHMLSKVFHDTVDVTDLFRTIIHNRICFKQLKRVELQIIINFST